MTPTTPPKRATCATCLRALPACICRWIAPVAPAVELLILQHPLEVGNAKNSARLLHLCAAGSVLVTGEAFEGDALAAMLHRDGRMPLLLYPELAGEASLGVAPPPAMGRGGDSSRLRLVVLDATWRKSRKMLYLNPLLQQLPRLALRDMPASRYRIRKAHGPDQLSTLEAAAYALMQLEQDAQALQALLSAFEGFVAQQASYAHGAVDIRQASA
jgi:DTW domain-containing protein YfiP